MTMHPLMHYISCRVFWQNIKSPRWLSPPTAQISCPVTSGFSPNQTYLWKGRDFRSLMRFRKIQWGSWWQLGELCEVPMSLLCRGPRHHCPMYKVSCILHLLQYMSLFFIAHGWKLSGQTSFTIYSFCLLSIHYLLGYMWCTEFTDRSNRDFIPSRNEGSLRNLSSVDVRDIWKIKSRHLIDLIT